MILWQSLTSMSTATSTVRPAPAATMINTSYCPGPSSMISEEMPRRMWRPPMVVYPIPDGLSSSRGRSPKVDRCRRWTDCAAEGGGEHRDQRRRLGRTFLLVLIIFVVTTAVADAARKRLVNEGASAALPQKKGQLPGAIPQVSCSWLKRCRPQAEAGRRRGRGARRAGIADLGRGGRSAVS
jgi:hypothetical protein